MTFQVGNMFGLKSRRATPVVEPAESSTGDVNDSNNAVKRWQRERDRMRKRVEELTGQLDAARSALEHARQVLGERMADELDTTTAMDELTQAESRVKALEAAVTSATQKDEAAQAELEQAERGLVIAEREEIHQRLCTMAGEAEELFIRIKLFRAELVRALTALRELGGPSERFGYGSNEIRLHFDHFMALANRPASAAAADSGAFQKYPSWTNCVEVVCGRRQIEYDR
jgi:hypothetical protein